VTTDPDGQSPGGVRAELLRGQRVVRSAWLTLSDTGYAQWQLTSLGSGSWRLRVVTPESATLAGSTGEVSFTVRS